MGVDAYILKYRVDDSDFASDFLFSADFDVVTLQAICKDLGISFSYSARKQELAETIARESGRSVSACTRIMRHLVCKQRGWLAFKTGHIRVQPQCLNPGDLVISDGEESWYGPIAPSGEDVSCWYVRPVFVPHWSILPGHTEPSRLDIRWLCFARVTETTVSLHWSGFSHAENVKAVQQHNAQFGYWEHVPGLFEEIEEITKAQVEQPNLIDLILYGVWDQYRYNDSYDWIDHRIRAESGGVALSARSGAVVDVDVAGIRGFANTIRRSVQRELNTRFNMPLPVPEVFDEVILKTILREYGTLSYEFSLQNRYGTRLFRAHCYFGAKPSAPTPDCFPHLNVYTTWRDDLGQLMFLLEHLQDGQDARNRPEQISMLW